jgi:L-ascorbate metabolism protein UlaG (beta-lactamase superfamily)
MQQYTSPKISLKTILKWQFSKSFSKKSPPCAAMPIIAQDKLPEGEYALWLGHASVWLHLGETTVAIDPVLGNIPLYHRQSPLPISKEALHTDIILITHAHYDHFDKPSVFALLKQNPECIIVAPVGFWRYLKGHIAREKCFELEWWESVMLGGLFITLVPSLHWSNRIHFDMNKALWGGYVIQNADHTIYHSGDTAYGEHFKEIAEKFDIDEAFLPIGAYRPEEIMKLVHTSPPEALQAAHDLGAKTLIPIHYGTFILSDEPLSEPIEWFEHLASETALPFQTYSLKVGEIYRFKTTSTFKST